MMELPKEAVDRRTRSIAILTSESVPVMPQLPVIHTAEETLSRSKEEVAYRALSVLTVALKGEGLDQPIVDRIVQEHGLAQYLSPKESSFIADQNPSRHDRIQFSWQYERAWVLLWALGYLGELGRPSQICDVRRAVGFMRERTTSQLLSDANPRAVDELLDQADLIYRYHWAVRSAYLKGEPSPAGLDRGVVSERHHALNWLTRYMDKDWDHVTTDT